MAYKTLNYKRKGGIVTLTLNRPHRLNAFDQQLLGELANALERVESEGAVRVLIITGQGRAFSAGADLNEWVEYEPTLVGSTPGLVLSQVIRCFETMGKVVIAAVNGYAAGGGCELALACDLRVASSTAQFALPEVKLGILPGAGGTQRLPRLIGAGRAKEMMFFGEFIGAEQALQWGLVTRVVPPEQLLKEAEAMGRVLLDQPVNSLRMIKKAVNVGLQMDIDSGLELERQCALYLTTTEDRREGIRAFVEKRRPHFQGR